MPTFFNRFSSNVLPASIRTRLDRLLMDWQDKRSDKVITLSEFIDFSRKAIEEAMGVVAVLSDGATKKALVLEFAGLLFDTFEPVIKVRYPWLNWLLVLLGGSNGLRDEFLQVVTVLIEVIFVEKFSRPSTY